LTQKDLPKTGIGFGIGRIASIMVQQIIQKEKFWRKKFLFFSEKKNSHHPIIMIELQIFDD